MKPKAVIILVVFAALAAFIVMGPGGKNVPKRQPVEVGLSAPAIRLVGLDGKPWGLARKNGTAVLINFWATWCDTCKEELPSLQKLYELKGPDGRLEFVTVLYRDDPARAAAFMKDNKFTFPVYTDPDEAAAWLYGLTGVPETYIIDKSGVLRKKIIGPTDFTSPDAVGFFSRLIES